MKQNLFNLLLLVSVLSLARTTCASGEAADEGAIRQLEMQQQEAWNRHDAKAYADLFTEDGDCVNVAGLWWKGRPEIEKRLTDAYAFVFRESALTVREVKVKFLNSEFAVAHVRWTMTGAKTPHGLPTLQQGIQTQLLQKQTGKWLIAAFQNTHSEMPFPKDESSSIGAETKP